MGACKKILLVDDSSTVLMVEKTYLAGMPFELLAAGDGEQAIRMTLARRPDLILLDLRMPLMDGFEVCRRLKSDAETREIPIIIVTTSGGEADRERAVAAGCNDYITKPFGAKELIARIMKFLGKGAGEA
ncbi:MAG: response regulator [Vicinamibacteria bacterium]|nr:response regulator [Vicinamibacteria bacterium]